MNISIEDIVYNFSIDGRTLCWDNPTINDHLFDAMLDNLPYVVQEVLEQVQAIENVDVSLVRYLL